MRSKTRGRSTLECEITNISRHGFWILLGKEELFLPFKDFPWFKHASVSSLLNIELHGSDHLFWPDLDVDLCVDSIRHPEKYPLVFKENP